MVLAKFLCQAMACNFVILEKKIHKEKKNVLNQFKIPHVLTYFSPIIIGLSRIPLLFQRVYQTVTR